MAERTLGDLIASEDVLTHESQHAAPLTPSTSSVNEVDALGQPVALPTESANRVNDGSPVGAAVFGETPTYDPQAKLHMPTLDKIGIPTGHTTTSIDPQSGLEVPTDDGSADGWRKQVVAMAHKMLGTPYVWGGTSYSGVDCSGLIQLLYNKLGFHMPRISADQARSGKRISYKNLQPGDLVAVDNSSRNNGADHIGIYVGKGMVIQAPHPGGVVELTSINDGFSGGWGISLSHK